MIKKIRVTRFERTKKAKADFKIIFSNPKHPLYFAKDSDLAKRYEVIRHTVRSIREDLKVPSRTERILKAVKKFPLKKHTTYELSNMLGVKYQCLYRLIRLSKIRTKSFLTKRKAR